MSKQSKAKEDQGYQDKPVFPMCSNCQHFNIEIATIETRYGNYTKEQNIRCTIGGFAVKKQGNCKLHVFK